MKNKNTDAVKALDDIDLAAKRVLIRADLNVPIKRGQVTSDARIRAAMPTIEKAVKQGASVVVMSHLGRPKAGHFDEEFSLAPVALHLAELLGREVKLLPRLIDCSGVKAGEVALLENVRFLEGETANEPALSRQMAAQCDVFVMDAFGTAHRAHSSTHGVAEFAPEACAGTLLQGELVALQTALSKPAKPMVALVGGSKVSTKLEVLSALADIADEIVVGGGIANTFIAAAGFEVGKSLYEPDLVEQAKAIAERVAVPIPTDVVVSAQFAEDARGTIKAIDAVGADDLILDIGPVTARAWANRFVQAGTILWNGPVGVFEFDQFGEGTRVLTEGIAASSAFSIAGGGDTLAAIEKYAVADSISYISTGGGAFLEFVEGKALPAVDILAQRGSD